MSEPTLTSSVESAGSPSPPDGQATAQSPSASGTNSASVSLPSSSGRLRTTPQAQDAKHSGKGKADQGRDLLCVEVQSSIPTSTTSTANATQGSLFSPEDSPANLSVSPGSDKARKMTAISGRKWSALLKSADLVSSWVRTLLESSAWNSTLCFLTWRGSATPAGRWLFRLVPSMPRTDETGCGFSRRDGDMFPIPKATQPPVMQDRVEALATTGKPATRKDGGEYQVTLEEKVLAQSLWPTPDTNNHRDGTKLRDAKKQGRSEGTKWGKSLHHAVVDKTGLWPTAQATDWKGSGKNGTPRDRLDYAVERGETKSKLYPTPDLGAAKGRGQASADQRNRLGGLLNPQFVEFLMGYPKDYTDVSGLTKIPVSPESPPASQTALTGSKYSETPSSPKSPTGSSG